MSNNIYRLEEILKCQITGEWGTECEVDNGICILRTTNFTNIGEIDYSNVVKRNISPKKIETKRLVEDDIILEKSGGSDNIPVGRVVYCDARIGQKVYLCNNFTQVLRVDKSKAVAKYVFYFLLFQHKRGYTELLQNKTTGIRNLQLKAYMEMRIPIPPIEEQKKIAEILDKASNLISLRKKQIEKLDLLVKAKFIDMFGDVVHGDQHPRNKLKNVAEIGSSKRIYANEYVSEGVPFYRSKEIRELGSRLAPSIELYISQEKYDEVKGKYGVPKRGDILIAAIGATIGYMWAVNTDAPFYYKDGNLILISNVKGLNSYYLNHSLGLLIEEYKKTNVAGSAQLALTIEKVQEMSVMCPPIELQNDFSDFVQQVEKQKEHLKQGLEKLELIYKALMQQYFN